MMSKKQLEENKYWINRLVRESLLDLSEENTNSYLKLGEVSARITDICKEVYHEEEVTVASCLQELYNLTEYPETYTDSKTGKPIDDDFLHDLIYNNIESLAMLLGIELKDTNKVSQPKNNVVDFDNLFS